MKSHIYEPPQLVARKARVNNKMRKEARQIITEESAAYKRRIVNAITAAVMLAANETWHIGEKRMCPMLENLAEWLNCFSDYMKDGVGFEMLGNQLKRRGLYALYDELILSKNNTDVR